MSGNLNASGMLYEAISYSGRKEFICAPNTINRNTYDLLLANFLDTQDFGFLTC